MLACARVVRWMIGLAHARRLGGVCRCCGDVLLRWARRFCVHFPIARPPYPNPPVPLRKILCSSGWQTDGHAPYDENAMLFMDYRTDYVDKADLSTEEAKGLDETPTFLYAMPMGTAPNGRKKIFFEEVGASSNAYVHR